MGRCKISTDPRNYRTIADFQVRTSKAISRNVQIPFKKTAGDISKEISRDVPVALKCP